MLAQADTMNYICNRIFKTAKQNINNLYECPQVANQ